MNVHPFGQKWSKMSPPVPTSEDTWIEQVLLHQVLAGFSNADRLADFCAYAKPEDFKHPVHARIAEHLIFLREEGREPSITSIMALFDGDAEIEPGLPARKYLGSLFIGPDDFRFQAPWRDTLEAWREHVAKNRMFDIGGFMQSCSTAAAGSVLEIAEDAVSQLDDVISGYRTGKLRAYDALGAADIAIEHLDGDSPRWPTTGFKDLDNMIGGWPRGQLSIIAARPGMGKSALAVSALMKTARAGNASVMFSLEMTGEQLGSRILTDLAYQKSFPIFYEDVLHRRCDSRQRDRLEEARKLLGGLPVRIEEQRGLTLAEVSARTRRLAAEFDRHGQKLSTVFVDHLGLIKPSSRYSGNRVREVAEISDGLATLASDLDISMVALHQLNRGVEGRDSKRPNLSDLRDSGAIEEDASVVLFAFRPAYYYEREKHEDKEIENLRLEKLEATKHSLELGIAKNRNGRIGVVNTFIDIGANAVRDLSTYKG